MSSDAHSQAIPGGIISRVLPVRDLNIHFLQAGSPSSPLLLLLHGFPELSASWRRVMLPLSQLGYHVVASDQRGYGQTVARAGFDRPVSYEDDLQPFRMINLTIDIIAFVHALGHRSAACVVGHDYGASVAGYCALSRPDIFQSVVIMSAPFTGPPALPFDVANDSSQDPYGKPSLAAMTDAGLAALQPPRKHYTAYYSGPTANEDMRHAPQGLHAFLRGYFHMKSADWPVNDPHPLSAPTPAALAVMPHYYIMPLGETMAEVVQHNMPSEAEVASNAWLPDSELALYTSEFARTGFQGGLNRYRCMRDAHWTQDLNVFSGLRIQVPAMFLSGRKDWGVYQYPGALDKMRYETCVQMKDEDVVLVEGAGHWVQQERPEEVIAHLTRFLAKQI